MVDRKKMKRNALISVYDKSSLKKICYVFKKLSIHYIEPGARHIDVELKELKKCTGKRKRHTSFEGAVTEEQKQKYNLFGDFVWYDEIQDDRSGNSMPRIKCIGDSFTCPQKVCGTSRS